MDASGSVGEERQHGVPAQRAQDGDDTPDGGAGIGQRSRQERLRHAIGCR